jgi:hypothetical protein
VAAAFNLLKELRMALHVGAHAEECGLHAIVVERVEKPEGQFFGGAVVECQISSPRPFDFDTPNGLGEEDSIEKWGLFDKCHY